jgi:DNA-directed RNA polymerase specialized sigma24 family protein
MSVNFSRVYKRFEEEQARQRSEYAALGMTEEQITAMYEFDRQQLARDLAYQRRQQSILSSNCGDDDDGDESKSVLLKKFIDEFSTSDNEQISNDRFWWINEITNPKLEVVLKSLSDDYKDLLTLLVFDGYKQVEIAEMQSKSKQSINNKLARIKKYFR